MIDLDNKPNLDYKCLVSMNDNSWIWHKRFAHAIMDFINQLSKNDLVVSLPKLKFIKDKICDVC